jgi:hypothetical protein
MRVSRPYRIGRRDLRAYGEKHDEGDAACNRGEKSDEDDRGQAIRFVLPRRPRVHGDHENDRERCHQKDEQFRHGEVLPSDRLLRGLQRKQPADERDRVPLTQEDKAGSGYDSQAAWG